MKVPKDVESAFNRWWTYNYRKDPRKNKNYNPTLFVYKQHPIEYVETRDQVHRPMIIDL
jgi:hypothetical protein